MNRKRLSLVLSNLLPTTVKKDDTKGYRRSLATIFRQPSNSKSSVTGTDRSIFTSKNFDSVVLVWLDIQKSLTTKIIRSFQSVNDSVRAYNDPSLCFDDIRYSNDKIFFISSSNNTELIATVHEFPAVEAIFVFDPKVINVKHNFPKFRGVFNSQDELLEAVKETLNVFEQVQFELFAYEENNTFLWRQLWKEKLTNRKTLSNKKEFIEATRNYYHDNIQASVIIDELEKSYRSSNVLDWCFRSPFPSRFLKHAIYSQNKEQLNLCSFLFADATRHFQKQLSHQFCTPVYRGMKLSSEQIDQFEEHVNELVCTSGFFPCTKSRTKALALASLPAYRPDLLPVLFKIDCESTDLFIEISDPRSSLSPTSIVFDICMAFRVMCIHRGEVTVIKLKPAGKDGKQIAQNYLARHKGRTIDSLLDQLLASPSALTQSISTPLELSSDEIKSSEITADEWKAKKYVEQGDTERALATYGRVYPISARILNTMGQLYVDKKSDYDHAFECHIHALKIQDQNGDDVSETLTYLGNIYHYRREFDMALACHKRALKLREASNLRDLASIAISLVGLANIYWVRQEYEEAIACAERALVLRETLVPFSRTELAKTLAMLGNIYRDSGNHTRALDRCLQALAILEREIPIDLYVSAELLHDLASICQDLGTFGDALQYLERTVGIYKQILPHRHPNRVSAENELKHARKRIEAERQAELKNIVVDFPVIYV